MIVSCTIIVAGTRRFGRRWSNTPIAALPPSAGSRDAAGLQLGCKSTESQRLKVQVALDG